MPPIRVGSSDEWPQAQHRASPHERQEVYSPRDFFECDAETGPVVSGPHSLCLDVCQVCGPAVEVLKKESF